MTRRWWSVPVALTSVLFALAGGTYYVVVDGYGSACGDYALLVTGEPPPVPVVSETWGRIKRRYR